jgi:hypothetical protein
MWVAVFNCLFCRDVLIKRYSRLFDRRKLGKAALSNGLIRFHNENGIAKNRLSIERDRPCLNYCIAPMEIPWNYFGSLTFWLVI